MQSNGETVKDEAALNQILDELRKLRVDVDGLKQRAEHGGEQWQPPYWNPHFTGQQPFVNTQPDTSPAAIGVRDAAPRSFELQSAFTELRDKYSNRSLHADLLFSTTRRNVRAEDAPIHSLLAKAAKYCETGLKIASGVTDGESSAELNDCLVVFTALMRHIQDEGVQLVVNKNYDKDWASQYRSIMSGQTDVRGENINAMDRTATILRHRYSSAFQATRGRGRGGRMRSANRGNSRGFHDVRARDRDAPQQSGEA